MMTKFKLLLLILQATFACSASFSQLFSNSDFELGDTNLCGCPTNYTCYNDAGRVTDSVHQDYTTGVLRGCECHDINPILCVNRTTPLKAHSGKSYVYFYAGRDEIRTASKTFSGLENIQICVWYCGPSIMRSTAQNSNLCHFSIGVDSVQVSPNVLVPVGTGWTKYCYTVSVTPGNHSFSILSGGIAQYIMWFDDFEINEIKDIVKEGNILKKLGSPSDTCSFNITELKKTIDFCMGSEIEIDAFYENASYIWSNGSTSSSITVKRGGLYYLERTARGCSFNDTISANEIYCNPKLVMPNVFTPNGDKLNDLFVPIEIEGINKAKLKIYNRWGDLVFETSEIKNGWDGKVNSKNAVEGVYFWTISYNDFLQTNLSTKGFLNLMR